MPTIAVYSPVAGYEGAVAGQEFDDGKAEVDASDLQALAYFQRHGYRIGDRGPVEVSEPPDPRFVSEQQVGTRLRDAAVDPRPGDFLPPTNAGRANPHGPLVVSPGIHAAPPAPIVPGTVSSDPAIQQEAEIAAATDALVPPDPVPVTVGDGAEEDRPSTKAKAAKKSPAK